MIGRLLATRSATVAGLFVKSEWLHGRRVQRIASTGAADDEDAAASVDVSAPPVVRVVSVFCSSVTDPVGNMSVAMETAAVETVVMDTVAVDPAAAGQVATDPVAVETVAMDTVAAELVTAAPPPVEAVAVASVGMFGVDVMTLPVVPSD